MNPYPFASLNHFTVPVAINNTSSYHAHERVDGGVEPTRYALGGDWTLPAKPREPFGDRFRDRAAVPQRMRPRNAHNSAVRAGRPRSEGAVLALGDGRRAREGPGRAASRPAAGAPAPGRAESRAGGPLSAGVEVPREPVARAVPGVELVLALRPAVPLARVDDELRLAARLDERVVELERLGQRRAEVVLAVQDQRRRAAVAGVVDGRASRVLAGRVVRFGLQEEPVELADVRRRVEADPVGHDREWHRGGEAVGLRDRP